LGRKHADGLCGEGPSIQSGDSCLDGQCRRANQRAQESRRGTAESGLLTTASGLVFGGDADGSVIAYDARAGKVLWNFQTGASISAAPATATIGGKQLVLVASGSTLFAFGLPGAGN
jgi:outer membrane protein assembly factor BamB